MPLLYKSQRAQGIEQDGDAAQVCADHFRYGISRERFWGEKRKQVQPNGLDVTNELLTLDLFMD